MRSLLVILFAFTTVGSLLGQQANRTIRVNGIVAEYENADIGKPFIVAIPGFTEHHATDEFLYLKRSFRAAGYGFLVLDPPQHGAPGSESQGYYTYGEKEPRKFLDVMDSLGVWRDHSSVHLLGFSIGAKIAIEMGILAERAGHSVSSVTGFATPYTLEDINGLLTGSIAQPFESLISMSSAAGRARLFPQLALDIFAGLYPFSKTPERNIADLKAPLLLMHTTNDWLTRAYHTLRLLPLATSSVHKEAVILRSYHHSEDVFTHPEEHEAQDFTTVYNLWVTNASRPDSQKKSWTETADDFFASPHEISRVPYQTYLDPWTNIWHTSPEYVPVSLALDAAYLIDKIGYTHHPVFNAGLGKQVTSDLGFRLDIGTADSRSTSYELEATGSIYYPIGTFVWVRRLGYTTGRYRSFFALDAGVTIIDFRVSYGNFGRTDRNWLLSLDLPLIAPGSGAYSFAIGVDNWFGSTAPHNVLWHAVITAGPRLDFLDARLRFSLTTQIGYGFSMLGGISLYPGEFF